MDSPCFPCQAGGSSWSGSCWQLVCELRAQEAVPALRGLCVCSGDEEKQERGCLVPPLGIFALPRPCQSQNRLRIHSCLFAERTRAQSVLNRYPKGLIPRCLHRAQGLGRCPPALQACTELGLQEDQTSELCVLLELLFQPGSAPGLCPGLPVLSQPHLSFPSLLGRASPQCCLTPRGLDVLGGSLGTDVAPAGTGFWDFPWFVRTLSFRCSFGRLGSLRTSLQLLFVTDCTPSIAFLVLGAAPHPGCIQWIPLGFSSGTTAALTPSHHEGPPRLRVSFSSRESRSEGSMDGL